MINGSAQQFAGLFNLPGEGFVVQLRNGSDSTLYDRQGLQYLILQRKRHDLDTSAAEEALSHLNNLQIHVESSLS